MLVAAWCIIEFSLAKPKIMQLPDINAVLFGRAKAKMAPVACYGPGHDTHHRSQWQSALLSSFLVLEAHCEPRSLLVSQRARGARNENKIVI